MFYNFGYESMAYSEAGEMVRWFDMDEICGGIVDVHRNLFTHLNSFEERRT